MSKTIRAAAIACIATVMLASCASATDPAESSGDSLRVNFANFTESSPTFRVLHTTLDDVTQSVDTGVEVKWFDNNSQPDKMLQNAQLMIQEQPDAIVMYPVTSATQGVSQLLADSGIPCVAVNIDVDACDFMNLDAVLLGVETAEIIGKIAQERGWNAGNTTILLGQNAALGEAVNGGMGSFYNTIAPMLGMEQVDTSTITATTTKIGSNAIQFDGQSTLQPSNEAVRNLLPSIPGDHNIILYTVTNDSTVGALRAIEDAGRGGDDEVLIGGLGGDEVGLKALREDPRWVAEGDIFGPWWGVYAVAMAKAVAEGTRPTADLTPLPQVVMDKNTVNTYYEAGSSTVKSLPALVADNQFLAKSGYLQMLATIDGLN